MRLWEAMLKGSKITKQIFRKFDDNDGGACALGAAEIGLTGSGRKPMRAIIYSAFPELEQDCACPECGTHSVYGRELSSVIVHLNDDHRWSRQRIAEWLANRELEFKPSQTVPIESSTQLQEVGK